MKNNKTVAIFGAGVAGLTAAHEFSKLGYTVKIYEANAESGGFFRSARNVQDHNSPAEYSWHGIGPFYHNVFSLFKEIPFDSENSLYDSILSRPINFGLAQTSGIILFDEPKDKPIDIQRLFSFTKIDYILWSWLILKVWCSNKRSYKDYAKINAKNWWSQFLSTKGINNWSACFGPWIGSDYFHVSAHQVGNFFLNQLVTNEKYTHKEDSEGGAWIHTARSGWLLLNGPSNEVLFDKWVSHLKAKNVEFYWNNKIDELKFDHGLISSGILDSGIHVVADIYVLAINPFSVEQVIKKTPELLGDKQLQKFKGLIKDGPHTQVSFRLAFKDQILWDQKRCGIIIVDSAYNLTLFAQEQAWVEKTFLGDEIKSLWTVTACVSKQIGSVHGLTLEKCTKQQFIDEVLAQLYECNSLNDLILKSNNGRALKDFEIANIEVWHEWLFASKGISSVQPKWVNSTNTQKYIPKQKTTISNLVLAGAHTETSIDVWSLEAAVESGKRAAKVFEPDVVVKIQSKPLFLRLIRYFDDILYFFKFPNIIDLLIISLLISLFFIAYSCINKF
jgi:uncharacterized protein with NAD-binding domain and iron-sulfur cluster